MCVVAASGFSWCSLRSTAMPSTYQRSYSRMRSLVFVVDGVPERRSVIQQGLEQAGYLVEVFATMRALEAAEQRPPAALIVAVELPDGSGAAFCDSARRSPALAGTATILLADNKPDRYRAWLESN